MCKLIDLIDLAKELEEEIKNQNQKDTTKWIVLDRNNEEIML